MWCPIAAWSTDCAGVTGLEVGMACPIAAWSAAAGASDVVAAAAGLGIAWPACGSTAGGFAAAGLAVGLPETGFFTAAGLTAGVDAAGLDAAGFDAAGFRAAGLATGFFGTGFFAADAGLAGGMCIEWSTTCAKVGAAPRVSAIAKPRTQTRLPNGVDGLHV